MDVECGARSYQKTYLKVYFVSYTVILLTALHTAMVRNSEGTLVTSGIPNGKFPPVFIDKHIG